MCTLEVRCLKDCLQWGESDICNYSNMQLGRKNTATSKLRFKLCLKCAYDMCAQIIWTRGNDDHHDGAHNNDDDDEANDNNDDDDK